MTVLTVAGTIPQWTLGDRLRKAREAAGLTQTELAKVMGISRRSISTYESDESAPRRPTLLAWAMATGVPLSWLAGDDGGPDGRPRQDSNLQPTDWASVLVRRGPLVLAHTA